MYTFRDLPYRELEWKILPQNTTGQSSSFCFFYPLFLLVLPFFSPFFLRSFVPYSGQQERRDERTK